jgi:hypothetical protein
MKKWVLALLVVLISIILIVVFSDKKTIVDPSTISWETIEAQDIQRWRKVGERYRH